MLTVKKYVYPNEYRGARDPEYQIRELAKAFELSPDASIRYLEKIASKWNLADFVPSDALHCTQLFAWPSVDAIAKCHFPEVSDSREKYCRAVLLLLSIIGKSRSFYNYREGQIDPYHLRQCARTLHTLDLIIEQQKGDILIVPAQFGLYHRDRSVCHARDCFTANESGLGALAVGSMTLIHPERYVHFEQLHTDCAGDEFAPHADGDFSESPIFGFNSVRLGFGAGDVSDAHVRCGSASGFVP